MKKTFLILYIFCSIAACKKSDNGSNNGIITGSVKIIMGNDSTGVANIKLYLLSADVAIDTLHCNNKKAFTDSILTDDTGKYTFNNVKPGKYAIIPQYKPGYKITPIGRSLDKLIEMGENKIISINFADEINFMGSGTFMSIRINFVNMKQSDYPTSLVVAKYRRSWVFFVPFMQYVSTVTTYNRKNFDDGTFFCSCQADIPRAMTFLCYSWDNYISFDLINSNSLVTSPVVESFQCYYPFEASCADIEYDGKTKVVKQK
jgi:hypothetical protein